MPPVQRTRRVVEREPAEKGWLAKIMRSAAESSHVSRSLAMLCLLVGVVYLHIAGLLKVRGKKGALNDLFALAFSPDLSTSGFIEYFHLAAGSEEPRILFRFSRWTFPGLLNLCSALAWICHLVGLNWVTVDGLATLCGPFFACVSAYVTYLIGQRLRGGSAGLLAAFLLLSNPAFYLYTVDGVHASGAVGMSFSLLCLLFFMLSCDYDSAFFASIAAILYALTALTWAGFIVLPYLLSAFVLCLIAFGKIGPAVYRSFTITMGLGLLLTLFMPAVGLRGLYGADYLPLLAALGIFPVFARVPRMTIIFLGLSLAVCALSAFFGLLPLTAGGGQYLQRLITSSPVAFSDWFRAFHVSLFLLPLGMAALLKRSDLLFLTVTTLTLALAAMSPTQIPLLTPFASISSAVGIVSLVKSHTKRQEERLQQRRGRVAGSGEHSYFPLLVIGLAALLLFHASAAWTTAKETRSYLPPHAPLAYSPKTSQLRALDDFREAQSWLAHNTPVNATVASWFGTGHQLALLARHATLGRVVTDPVHSYEVAAAFLSDETEGAKILRRIGVTHVLLIFGGMTGYAADDLRAVPSMLRAVEDQFTFNYLSLLRHMAYHNFATMQSGPAGFPPGVDLVDRSINYRNSLFPLRHFEEVYTTQHWLVRIFRLLPENEVRSYADLIKPQSPEEIQMLAILERLQSAEREFDLA